MRKEITDKLAAAVRGLSDPKGGVEQYKILTGMSLAPDEVDYRENLLSGLPAVARSRYVMAAVDLELAKLGVTQIVTRKVFGGMRKSMAIPCRGGGSKVFSVDITIDRNAGLVITQWVTKNRITKQETVTGLLTQKSSIMAETKLDERFFMVYSCVRGVTEQKTRSVDSLLTLAVRQLEAQVASARNS